MPEGPLNEAPRAMERASAAAPIRDPDPVMVFLSAE